jgi:molecular chaperone IbpA
MPIVGFTFFNLLNKGVKMTRITAKDLTPLYRNSIGVDKILNHVLGRMESTTTNYPPYNIVRTSDDEYVIEIAIAGFEEGDVNITVDNGQLVVQSNKDTTDTREYLHQGLAFRKFTKTFDLADYVEVQNAVVQNGILTISLEIILPDAIKPKQIEVTYTS